tara:strand:- start:484 stop:675 length:192 start_codon:yes stop_codon:yes gene_type:complete
MTVDDISTCHCFIRHAVTKEDREAVTRRLEYAREIGDSNGIIIALAQLTGNCPARRAAQEQSA